MYLGFQVIELHNEKTHKRRIQKCGCCNKRLRKVISYECRTDDCEYYSYMGVSLRDIKGPNTPSDLWLEEHEGED